MAIVTARTTSLVFGLSILAILATCLTFLLTERSSKDSPPDDSPRTREEIHSTGPSDDKDPAKSPARTRLMTSALSPTGDSHEKNISAGKPPSGASTDIRGVVLDHRGHPLEGATVTFASPRGLTTHDRALIHVEGPLSGSGQTFQGSTSSDGRFEISIAASAPTLVVSVDHPEFIPWVRTDLPPPAPNIELAPIQLRRGATIRGRVLTPQGLGEGHVRIEFDPDFSSVLAKGWSKLSGVQSAFRSGIERRTISDADGHFSLQGLWDVPGRLLTRGQEGSITSSGLLFPRSDQSIEDIVLTLDQGLSLRGLVLDDLDAPVPHAQIRASYAASTSTSDLGWTFSCSTDPRGEFTIEGAPSPSALKLTIDAPGFTRTAKSWPRLDLDQIALFRLRPQGSIAGRVTKFPEPVSTRLLLESRDGVGVRPLGSVRWQDRAFEVDGIDPGTYRLLVETSEGIRGRSDIFVVDAGQRTDGVHVDVNENPPLEGIVCSARNAAAIPGAVVTAFPLLGEDEDKELARTSTNEKGRFQLPSLQAGAYRLEVTHNDFAPTDVEVFFTPRDWIEARIELLVGGSIEGELHGSSGPRGGVLVKANLLNPKRKFRTRTDALGVFSFSHLSPGTYSIWHGSTRRTDGPKITMIAEEPQRDHRLVEVLDERTSTVSFLPTGRATLVGRITSAQGSPLKAVTVRVQRVREEGDETAGLGFPESARTDRDGQFRIPDLDIGLYCIEVRAETSIVPHRGRQTLETPGEHRYDVALEVASIDGTITSGEPSLGVADARVTLRRESGAFYDALLDSHLAHLFNSQAEADAAVALRDPQSGIGSTRSNTTGAFKLADVPMGTYRLVVVAPGYVSWTSDPFDLTSSTPSFSIRLDRESTLSVWLRSATDQQPLPSYIVRLQEEDGPTYREETDEDGLARFSAIPSRPLQLRVFDPQGEELEALSRTITPTPQTPMELSLEVLQ